MIEPSNQLDIPRLNAIGKTLAQLAEQEEKNIAVILDEKARKNAEDGIRILLDASNACFVLAATLESFSVTKN